MFQRITGLEDLQSQINQIKIMTGASIKFQPSYRSQMDDLDTGLGWDDLATPGTSGAEFSRQHMSDASKPPPTIQEDEEDSHLVTKGGLKTMNIPSPTDRTTARAEDSSPVNNGNTNGGNQNFMDPGNATPDNWKSPREGGNTPVTNRSKGKGGAQSPGAQSVGARSQGNRSVGGRSQGNMSAGGRSQGNRSAGGRSQGNRSAGGGSQGNRSAGARSQGGGPNSQREQDSGLNDV